MIIALDDSLVHYALKHAFHIGDTEEINYICNRISEAVPIMPHATTLHALQDVSDYLEKYDPDYLKRSPLTRLQEVLEAHSKDFKS